MEKSDCTILSTRPLPQALLEEAAAKGFHIDCRPFIETAPLQDEATVREIKKIGTESTTVVFTSMNAVDAVRAHFFKKPHWRIYAIGHATKQLVEEHLGPVAGTAEYGGELADVIIQNGEREVTFFCGDIRRDELPDKLIDAGIRLHEVIVYHTVSLPHKIEKQYDGVLFFSPSAVHAFFSNNALPEETVIFAIGRTTAAALNTYTTNRIYVADSPSKEGLLRDAMDFFRNLKQPTE